MPFTTVRDLTTPVAAETGAPAAAYANFATVPGLTTNGRLSRLVELRLDSPVLTGSPTSVIFDIYRLNEGTMTVDYITTWTVAATDITASKVAPIIVEMYSNQVTVKVSFSGGTAPTFGGKVMGRALE